MRPIDYFDRGNALNPESVFIAGEGEAYTYRETQGRTEAIAKALFHAGFEVGDSVAVYSANDPGAVVCIFGAYRAGGAWVPVNVRNAAATNAEYMAYVKTRWLFFHSSVLEAVEQVIPQLTELKAAVCFDSDQTPYPSLADFSAAGAAQEIPDWSDAMGAPDVIFSRWPTGGTTGPSKGVDMSNRSVTTMIEKGLDCYVGKQTKGIVHLAVAPITHAAGVVITIYATVGGKTIVLPAFDAKEVLESIEKEQVTHIFLPPTAYYAMLDEAKRKNYNTASLRQVLIAAAPVSPDKFKEGVDVFGPVICQCYGQSEAPMLISWLSPEVVAAAATGEHPERLKSAGQVTSCTQVGILDDDGNLMPTGERGEICCRGPLVTPGYFEKPEATAEARKFGWHHTGDIGYLDEDNYLYIVDRKKDMIITGGFNVFAAEVEAPILALPEVLECAVVGVPDDKWGEAIKAVIVLKTGSTATEAAIIDAIKGKLGGVKTPKSIEFWDEIPKTAVGKTDKKVIRKRYWGAADRGVN